jgi:hypothetical protein
LLIELHVYMAEDARFYPADGGSGAFVMEEIPALG